MPPHFLLVSFFFFNDTATTEIYTLSLHDALPISKLAFTRHPGSWSRKHYRGSFASDLWLMDVRSRKFTKRSEEHTSELQSQSNLVCRLLLEKKNTAPIRL